MEEKNITTSGVLQTVNATGSDDFVVQITGYNGASGNVKIRGALSYGTDFTQPDGKENPWSYINLSSNTKNENVDGAIGLDLAEGTLIFELNVNLINSFAVELSVSSGEFDVVVVHSDNR